MSTGFFEFFRNFSDFLKNFLSVRDPPLSAHNILCFSMGKNTMQKSAFPYSLYKRIRVHARVRGKRIKQPARMASSFQNQNKESTFDPQRQNPDRIKALFSLRNLRVKSGLLAEKRPIARAQRRRRDEGLT